MRPKAFLIPQLYFIKAGKVKFVTSCCINRFTALFKNLLNLLEFLTEAFSMRDGPGGTLVEERNTLKYAIVLTWMQE